MDKITVVCHKDHDKGYEDYVGKCLLCEVERLENREWVGLTEYQRLKFADRFHISGESIEAIEAKLKEKNT